MGFTLEVRFCDISPEPFENISLRELPNLSRKKRNKTSTDEYWKYFISDFIGTSVTNDWCTRAIAKHHDMHMFMYSNSKNKNKAFYAVRNFGIFIVTYFFTNKTTTSNNK